MRDNTWTSKRIAPSVRSRQTSSLNGPAEVAVALALDKSCLVLERGKRRLQSLNFCSTPLGALLIGFWLGDATILKQNSRARNTYKLLQPTQKAITMILDLAVVFHHGCKLGV